MKTLALLVALLAVSVSAASAQDELAPDGTPIRSADVSGLALDQLSPGLRKEIAALAGTPLSRERLRELASRIEAEKPETVAAIRSTPPQDGAVRIIFLVGRISDDGDLLWNINARYIVESVAISGVDETTIPQEVRDELQRLVGSRLDPDEAERLDKLLADELPGHEVKRRIERGSEPGQIRVIFEVGKAEPQPWIPFTPSRSKLVYHAYQGWSGALDIPLGGPRHHRFTLGFVFDNEDDLIEEYSGYRFRFESRKLFTDHLGASVEFSQLRETWREATLLALDANPFVPEAYRERTTIEPLATFAFGPTVRVAGGVSINELESLSRSPASQMASVGVFSFDYDQTWKGGSGARQHATARYELRSAASALGSDLDYTRHLARARYEYTRNHSSVSSNLVLGRASGDPPLFERFTLGDTSTLRGWNKYDIAPIGGTRAFHHSLEYRYRVVGVFLDTGSVWERDASVRTRLSTGFGLSSEHFFAMVGIPLNADSVRATFIAGVRF